MLTGLIVIYFVILERISKLHEGNNFYYIFIVDF